MKKPICKTLECCTEWGLTKLFWMQWPRKTPSESESDLFFWKASNTNRFQRFKLQMFGSLNAWTFMIDISTCNKLAINIPKTTSWSSRSVCSVYSKQSTIDKQQSNNQNIEISDSFMHIILLVEDILHLGTLEWGYMNRWTPISWNNHLNWWIEISPTKFQREGSRT